MIYFFINIIMYLMIITLLLIYFKNKMSVNSFIIILFNMNVFVLFIYQNINFVYGLIVLFVSLVIYYFSNLFTKEYNEIILIKDGNINFHELINNYSYYKLINYLKIRNYKLDEIAYCIKKGHHIVVIKNQDISFPITLILNGNIISSNLKLINKEEKWLNEELLNHNLLVKNVEYAYYKNNNVYFINNS